MTSRELSPAEKDYQARQEKKASRIIGAGSPLLEHVFPEICNATESGKGVDVIVMAEQTEFAKGWLVNASQKDFDIINATIKSEYPKSLKNKQISPDAVVRLIFFDSDSNAQIKGKYVSGTIVHANVSNCGDDTYWDNLARPTVLLSFAQTRTKN
jgi:hypothetical protein